MTAISLQQQFTTDQGILTSLMSGPDTITWLVITLNFNRSLPSAPSVNMFMVSLFSKFSLKRVRADWLLSVDAFQGKQPSGQLLTATRMWKGFYFLLLETILFTSVENPFSFLRHLPKLMTTAFETLDTFLNQPCSTKSQVVLCGVDKIFQGEMKLMVD